jgi:hypothetical protein
MNILPSNPADREAKSPCDKNIRYPVCVPGHDSPNGTFLTIVVYDKQKTTLVDVPSDLINTRRLPPGRKPRLRAFWPRDTWIIHSGGFIIYNAWQIICPGMPGAFLEALGGVQVFPFWEDKPTDNQQ